MVQSAGVQHLGARHADAPVPDGGWIRLTGWAGPWRCNALACYPGGRLGLRRGDRSGSAEDCDPCRDSCDC